MWKWVLGIAAVPLGAAAIVVGVGAMLPRDHIASMDRFVPVDPAAVASMVRTVDRYPEWRSGVQRIELRGRDAGGVRFTEHGSEDPIAFHLVEEAENARFRSTIDDPALPFGGYWTITLTPENRGTRVRIEERGFVTNWIYRFFARFLFGHDRSMRIWLDDLERAVGPT